MVTTYAYHINMINMDVNRASVRSGVLFPF